MLGISFVNNIVCRPNIYNREFAYVRACLRKYDYGLIMFITYVARECVRMLSVFKPRVRVPMSECMLVVCA